MKGDLSLAGNAVYYWDNLKRENFREMFIFQELFSGVILIFFQLQK
jgi:hypothetical protein